MFSYLIIIENNKYEEIFSSWDWNLAFVCGVSVDTLCFVFRIENFQKFLNDVKAGNLEPFLKSEPLPDDNSGAVKVAVAKNFDELVTDSGRDALIEFYAPWCGHCKKLAPIFDDLGDKMIGEDVDIIKMDATANDVPPLYDVRGFPTLYWSPKDAKSSPKRYEVGIKEHYFLSSEVEDEKTHHEVVIKKINKKKKWIDPCASTV